MPNKIFFSYWPRDAATDPSRPPLSQTSPPSVPREPDKSATIDSSSSVSMEKLAVARASLQLNLVHNTQIVQVRENEINCAGLQKVPVFITISGNLSHDESFILSMVYVEESISQDMGCLDICVTF